MPRSSSCESEYIPNCIHIFLKNILPLVRELCIEAGWGMYPGQPMITTWMNSSILVIKSNHQFISRQRSCNSSDTCSRLMVYLVLPMNVPPGTTEIFLIYLN